MLVYRIASCVFINDLSGRGAALYGGRWNSRDVYVLYTAESAALSLLEAMVHMGKMPRAGYCLLTLDIPDDNMLAYTEDDLPPGWDANPAPDHLKMIGDRFVASGKYLALKLPSVVMPVEHNILLNPAHKDFRKIKVSASKPVGIDNRLLG